MNCIKKEQGYGPPGPPGLLTRCATAPYNKCDNSKYSTYQKSNHNVEYKNNEKIEQNIAVLEYIRLAIIMAVIYCYLEREN